MKCDVLFSQGGVRTIFRRGGYFSYMSKKIYSSLQQCKNYKKNLSRFSKVMITNVLPPFYGSQCIFSTVNTVRYIGYSTVWSELYESVYE